MAYFTRDFIDFFKELQDNNNREWFNDNKKRFKSNVEKPFVDFVQAVINCFQKYEPGLLITPKEAVFRIYRDVRFSQDKSPYKDHMGAVVATGGKKGDMMGGAYLEMNGTAPKLYGGVYMPDKQKLENIRYHIAANQEEFSTLLNDPTFKKYFGEIRGDKNKRLPKEFDEAAAKQPLLYNKSFYFFHQFKPESLLKDDFLTKIEEAYLAGKPMGEFLARGARGEG